MRFNVVLLAALMSNASIAADGVQLVTLSCGGFAEATRSVSVDGNGTVSVKVPPTQVNNVLKSLFGGGLSGSVASRS